MGVIVGCKLSRSRAYVVLVVVGAAVILGSCSSATPTNGTAASTNATGAGTSSIAAKWSNPVPIDPDAALSGLSVRPRPSAWRRTTPGSSFTYANQRWSSPALDAGPEIAVASTKAFLTQLGGLLPGGAVPGPGPRHQVPRRDQRGDRPARADAGRSGTGCWTPWSRPAPWPGSWPRSGACCSWAATWAIPWPWKGRSSSRNSRTPARRGVRRR